MGDYSEREKSTFVLPIIDELGWTGGWIMSRTGGKSEIRIVGGNPARWVGAGVVKGGVEEENLIVL